MALKTLINGIIIEKQEKLKHIKYHLWYKEPFYPQHKED